MNLKLLNSGEAVYNDIYVNKGDKVELKTWNMISSIGTVIDITNEYVDLTIDKRIIDINNKTILGLNRIATKSIYGIDIILRANEVELINEIFRSKYKKEFCETFIEKCKNLDIKNVEEFMQYYTSSAYNRLYIDNVFRNLYKKPVYELCEDIYMNLKQKIHYFELVVDTENEKTALEQILSLGLLKEIKK